MTSVLATPAPGAAGIASIPLEQRLAAAVKDWHSGAYKHLTHVAKAWCLNGAGYQRLRRRLEGRPCQKGNNIHHTKLNEAQDSALLSWADAEVKGGARLDALTVARIANDFLEDHNQSRSGNRRWAIRWMKRKGFERKQS